MKKQKSVIFLILFFCCILFQISCNECKDETVLCNLVIKEIKPSTYTPLYDEVTLTVTIANEVAESECSEFAFAPNSTLALFVEYSKGNDIWEDVAFEVGNQTQDYIAIPVKALNPGEEVTIEERGFTFGDPGAYRFKAIPDYYDIILESDEINLQIFYFVIGLNK